MKNTIAGKVTIRVFAICLAAFIVLLAGSFVFVQNMVYSKNQSYSRAVVTMLIDITARESKIAQVPIDPSHAEITKQVCEYACKWYNIDYAYMYVPDEKGEHLTYIYIARKGDTEAPELKSHKIGETKEYILTPEEKKVWDGEEVFAIVENDNEYGHDIQTIVLVEDSFGNKALAGVDMSYERVYGQIFDLFTIISLIIALVILCVVLAVYLIIQKHVSRPAKVISKRMSGFISDGERTDVKIPEDGPEEYAKMASAFNKMTENIDEYVENINKLTRDSERQNAELSIASSIQKGFLPKEHFDADKYEIRAVMTPARNIGGDLYDYMPLDDNRVLIVIADVSGKGVSAAIFMAVTLVLLHQYAKSGMSPAEILKNTNDILAGSNPNMLFATAFVGIYDSETKSFTYSNAGHNLPYITGKEISRLDGARGALIGIFEGEEYTEETVTLNRGDTLFLYTDGVSETVNKNKEFFGEDRLEKTLGRFKKTYGENPISVVTEDITAFADGAEQHDDTTMITLTVKDCKEIMLDVDIHELTKIKEEIFALPMPRTQQMALHLAAEECFVNICSYAFPDGVPEGEKVRLTLKTSDRVVMRFEDSGMPFNPLDRVADPDEYDIETRIGGLGNFIAVSSVDNVKYEYINGKNTLTFTKYIIEEEE